MPRSRQPSQQQNQQLPDTERNASPSIGETGISKSALGLKLVLNLIRLDAFR
jgi:hypothetical protein